MADLIAKGLASHWTISSKIYRNEGHLITSNSRYANCTVAFVQNQLFVLRNTLKGGKCKIIYVILCEKGLDGFLHIVSLFSRV